MISCMPSWSKTPGFERRATMKASKQSLMWFALVLTGILVGWFGRGLAAGDQVLPGSEEDPLVTRSYVDSYVDSSLSSALSQSAAMLVVELEPGQRLIASAGTEIILRAGSATALDSHRGGLADVTSGDDIRHGQEIGRNHLLIAPRDDGRGVLAVTSAVLMVRGAHTIQ